MKAFVNGLKNTSGALTAAVLSAAMIICMFPAGALAEEIEITPEFSVEESVETEVNVADEIISENHDEEIFTVDHEDVLLSGDIDNDEFSLDPNGDGEPVAEVICEGNAIAYTDIASAVSAWNETAGATLKLLSNVSVSETIEVDNGSTDHPMILDLNDHGIIFTGAHDRVIFVNPQHALRFTDGTDPQSQTKRYIVVEAGRGSSVTEEQPSEGNYVAVTGGYITGGSTTEFGNSAGAGVYISKNAAMFMDAGTICCNYADSGGGGIINFGTLRMTGGTISNNSAEESGGGVENYGHATFIMDGGMICGNSCKTSGGGVYQVGVFKMNGGSICDNSAKANGGGIHTTTDGVTTISAGLIAGNTAGEKGSAVYVYTKNGVMKGKIIFSGVVFAGVNTDGSDTERIPAYTAAADHANYGYFRVESPGMLVTKEGEEEFQALSMEEAAEKWNEWGAGASLRLLKDVTAAETIVINEGSAEDPMILDLNDHGILFAGEGSVIRIAGEHALEITDGDPDRSVRYLTFTEGRGTAIESTMPAEGTDYVEVSGGFVTGGTGEQGYGVEVDGTLVLSCGTILGNQSSAVYVSSSGTVSYGDNRAIFAGSKNNGSDAEVILLEDKDADVNERGFLKADPDALKGGASCVISGASSTVYLDFEEAVQAWNAAENGALLKLLSDITVTDTISVDGGWWDAPMILDLNDHGILMKGDNSVISVSESSIFMLVDRSATQTDRFIRIEDGRGKEVYEVEPHEDGLIKVTGGYITGGLSATGGGILNSGTFIMSGGTIAGNRAYAQGGGIYTGLQSQLMINGGVIVSNTAQEGKAVYNDGGNIRIKGEILAGSESDGSDAGKVSPGKASDDAETYGFLSAASFTYDPIAAQTYTGKAIVPDIKVYYCGTLLRKNKDYKIKFSNNINADGNASFTITGKGNTSGKFTGYFTIIQKDIADDDILITTIPDKAYDKKVYKPVPSILRNNQKLKSGTDFKVLYFSSDEDAVRGDSSRAVTPKDTGTYYARIEGKKNYTGHVIKSFKIFGEGEKIRIPVSKLTIGKIGSVKYDGTKKMPEITVSYGKKKLTKDVDYKLEYGDNIEAGTGTVIIEGLEDYTGSRTVTFKITGTPMSKVRISGIPKSVTYDGNPQTPVPALTCKAGKKSPEVAVSFATKEQYDALSEEEKENIQCIITYKNNTNAGTATVELKGIHGYLGTAKKTFKITPFTVSKDPDDLFRVELKKDSYPYAKAGVCPVPVVYFKDQVLTNGVDYTLSYSDNTAVNDLTGRKKPVVKVKGKKNFSGTDATAVFKIEAVDLASAGVKMIVRDMEESEKGGKFRSKISLIDRDGKTLKDGTDFDSKKAVFSYDEEGNDIIPSNTKVPAGTTVYVRADAKGNSYTGSVTGSYLILQKGHDISKLKVKVRSKSYTGKAVKLTEDDISFKSGKKTVEGVQFVIDASTYRNNVNKGTASVEISGTGDWGGTVRVTYKIGSRGLLFAIFD